MSTETLIIEGNLVYVDYDSEQEEAMSMYSPGYPEGLCVNSVTFKDGKDALPFIMAIDGETAEQALAWVERLLDRKLSLRAEESQIERHGRRSWQKY